MIAIDVSKLHSSCFNGIYKDFIELLGYDNTLLIYRNFSGQYVTFPQKLLSGRYLRRQILEEFNGSNAKELAKRYGYSYSWVCKLIKASRG